MGRHSLHLFFVFLHCFHHHAHGHYVYRRMPAGQARANSQHLLLLIHISGSAFLDSNAGSKASSNEIWQLALSLHSCHGLKHKVSLACMRAQSCLVANVWSIVNHCLLHNLVNVWNVVKSAVCVWEQC